MTTAKKSSRKRYFDNLVKHAGRELDGLIRRHDYEGLRRVICAAQGVALVRTAESSRQIAKVTSTKDTEIAVLLGLIEDLEADLASAEDKLDRLKRVVIQPWTRDDGANLFKVNLSWLDTTNTYEGAERMVDRVVERVCGPAQVAAAEGGG